jgi:hypothetical protein
MYLKRFEEIRHYFLIPYENIDELKLKIKTPDTDYFIPSITLVNDFLISKGFHFTEIISVNLYERVQLNGWFLEVHGIQPIALGMFGI